MPDEASTFSPALEWRRAWRGEGAEDFIALWKGTAVGRFYRYDVSSLLNGQWLWTVFAFHRSPTAESGCLNGFVDGPASKAARVVEEAFERARTVWGVPDVIRFAPPHTEAR
ncbi:hypothetical protein [Jiella pacifica]|uniref:Uncharacterized protein n=1 Tax=Jiella pacifica TaxID=2696469 RepID=A0A6N9SY91_9HYPH|nr:hypothetical protein [Jiella pacifica]NDW04063.1 hypothetical protein [Jiella pacifica]